MGELYPDVAPGGCDKHHDVPEAVQAHVLLAGVKNGIPCDQSSAQGGAQLKKHPFLVQAILDVLCQGGSVLCIALLLSKGFLHESLAVTYAFSQGRKLNRISLVTWEEA